MDKILVVLEGEEHEKKVTPKRRKRASSKANVTKEKDEEIVPGKTIIRSGTTLA